MASPVMRGTLRLATTLLFAWVFSACPGPNELGGATPGASRTLALGQRQTCAIRGTGASAEVVCWGDTERDGRVTAGRCLAVPMLAGVVEISAGDVHTCARLSGGTVRCWGESGSGQLGGSSTTTDVPGLTGVQEISAGGSHTCARLSGGTVRCWGSNTAGQLGGASTTTDVPGLTSVVGISAGSSHTCARRLGGTVRCWGDNTDGRLGGASSTMDVPGLTGVQEISAGGSHTCARLSGGTVRCWGSNTAGQLGGSSTTTDVPGLTGVVEITAGGSHTCARLSGGAVRCWGDSADGRLGGASTTTDAPGLTGVLEIDAGASHTCARIAGGGTRCWGANSLGQLGDGTTMSRSMPVAMVCISGCSTGTSMCPAGCANLMTDNDNCGACGTRCTMGQTCTAGVCTLVCPTGQTNCGGTCFNLMTTASHCGACGMACSFPNAAATCANGTCALGACNMGFGNCDNNATNGCETDLNTSTSNCGACGTVCTTMASGLVPVCRAGTCGTTLGTCPAGRADCNMMAGDGCEVDTATTLAHCGGCGMACARANAAATCAGGACVLGACNPGFGDCDMNPANGCETDTRSSAMNCGACGTVCASMNASGSCTNSVCALGTCNAGFGNCDGDAANGCETNTTATAAHCGACGMACNLPNVATHACAASTCGITACAAGFGDCNTMAADGCEASTTTVTNCGRCGNACPTPAGAVGTCASGVCGFTCLSGRRDCDGRADNGCEFTGTTCPRTEWVRTGRVSLGYNLFRSVDVATDAAGNVYSLHNFDETAVFDGRTFTAPGGGAVLISHTRTGALRWALPFTASSGHLIMQRVAFDPRSGDLYVSGGAWGTEWLLDGRVRGALNVGGRWVAARIRTDGTVVWARTVGDGNDGSATALAVGETGEVYLGGSYQFDVAFDEIRLGVSNGGRSYEGYVVRLSAANGMALAAHRFGGNNTAIDRVLAIVPLPGGDYIVAGDFIDGDTTLGGVTIPGSTPTNQGAFYARVTATGTVVWLRSANSVRESIREAHRGPSGNVYISGLCEQAFTLGGFMVPRPRPIMTAFLARIDPDTGAPIWVDTNSEETEFVGLRRFVVDPSDTIHATWSSRSGDSLSTFGGTNLGITGTGYNSFVVHVTGATGVVTRVERFAGDTNAVVQSRAIALSGGRNVLSGVYWPMDFTASVEGVPWGNNWPEVTAQHQDAFTLFLNF